VDDPPGGNGSEASALMAMQPYELNLVLGRSYLLGVTQKVCVFVRGCVGDAWTFIL
jgi:hypothetical protein